MAVHPTISGYGHATESPRFSLLLYDFKTYHCKFGASLLTTYSYCLTVVFFGYIWSIFLSFLCFMCARCIGVF